MHAWFARSVLCVSAAPLMLLACSTPEQPSESLAAAEARWQAAGVHSYDYIITFSCQLCTLPSRPVSINVRSDTILSLTYADDGSPLDTAALRGYVTIDRTFQRLHQDLLTNPEVFTATYDPTFGYPRQVHIDMHANTADDEMTFSISTFARIP